MNNVQILSNAVYLGVKVAIKCRVLGIYISERMNMSEDFSGFIKRWLAVSVVFLDRDPELNGCLICAASW